MKRDAAALFSVFKESIDGVVEALALGNQSGAELALERLRRTQGLVDDWTQSLDTATSIAVISPWLRRHLPDLRKQARVVAAADLASRHLRTVTRRIVTVLADGKREPELAGLMGELGNAIALLGAELEDRQLTGASRTALADLAKRLDPSLLGSDAELRETLVVVLVRPLVLDLLVGTGMSPTTPATCCHPSRRDRVRSAGSARRPQANRWVRSQRNGRAIGRVLRRNEEVLRTFANDLVAEVVQHHVVLSAEEHAVGEVCLAVVAHPFVDVVCFAPFGWSLAVADDASAVSGGEGDALSSGEGALSASDIEGLTFEADRDGKYAVVARDSLGGSDGNRVGLALDACRSGAAP